MSRARDLANLGNNAGGLETLTVSDITDITATASELNKLDGVTATTDELNLVDGSVSGPLSHRNMVINGAMQVSQRGVSFDSQGTGSGQGYTVDRFAWVRRELTGSGFTFDATITQDADSPSGFDKSLKVVADTTQSSLSSSENALITTKFEGQDLQRFGWGTTDASAVTLSFWVKSNKTGTYCVQTRYIQNSDSGLFEYSVSASGTWEYKTITIPANTSVSFNNDNTLQMEVMFHLAVGPDDITTASTSVGTSNFRATSNQVNLFDAASNYWQITGVQLELGTVATPFEHRSYADELKRCERYYERIGNYVGLTNNTPTVTDGVASFRTTKRTSSYTIGLSSGTNLLAHPTITGVSAASSTASHRYINYVYLNFGHSSTGNAEQIITLYQASNNLYCDDEL